MSQLSNYAENALMDHITGTASYTSPTTVYISLHTADPTDAGTGTEISTGSYARQTITFGAASSRAVSNTSQETFTPSGASWTGVTHFGIWDASTSGNLLAYGAFDQSRDIADGVTFTIAAGDIDISFNSGGVTTYLANELLDHLLVNAAYTAPANLYTGLFTAAPGDAGGGTEVSGNGYARQLTAFGSASNGVASSSADESWTASGGDFGTLTHGGVFDALTTGNLLFYNSLSASQAVTDGTTYTIASGNISVGLA